MTTHFLLRCKSFSWLWWSRKFTSAKSIGDKLSAIYSLFQWRTYHIYIPLYAPLLWTKAACSYSSYPIINLHLHVPYFSSQLQGRCSFLHFVFRQSISWVVNKKLQSIFKCMSLMSSHLNVSYFDLIGSFIVLLFTKCFIFWSDWSIILHLRPHHISLTALTTSGWNSFTSYYSDSDTCTY